MKDISSLDWGSLQESLNTKGYAIASNVLSVEECCELKELYTKESLYRSVINMQRYRFGKGEYKYFSCPLPDIIGSLRELFYPNLAKIANQWMQLLGISLEYPMHHGELIDLCNSRNQNRPTPLILRYEEGGFNTLHQDLYGDIYFPFQVVLALAQEGKDFEGGEFVLIEQIPRAQSRAEVVKLNQGDALIFTTNFRPVKGTRGYYRATMKHGVSPIRSGVRYALGIIFHDAK